MDLPPTALRDAPPINERPAVSLGTAFRFWLKLGFISFGGPAGQIAIMHRELVERARWISEHRFIHALNYCMVLPGPEATQLAVYIGWLMHGTFGGVVAGVLFVLPGALLLVALSWLYVTVGATTLANGILFGFKCAAMALIVAAILRIGGKAVRSLAAVILAALSFGAMLLQIPFPALILAAGLIGWMSIRAGLNWFPPPKSSHAAGIKDQAAHAAAFIDDDTPSPPHARVNAGRLALQAAIFALLLGGPLLGLCLWRGYDDIFARMGRFFTLAAFVTVGGAYAVLPYVAHMSTQVYGWLKPGQMLDGLALGETTPGPLILVLTFVGFVGGWNQTHADLGPAGALLGAAIATYFTFLPSFMFILLGGPFVERTRGELRIGAVLAAISAAVAGVISHMALTFGAHLVLPPGYAGQIDIAAIALTLIAFVLLHWRKWDTMLVIAVCGAAGWALQAAGA